jgi:predicted acetyltransferase
MGNISLRRATADDFMAITEFDGATFGEVWPKEEIELLRPTLELDRFVLAHDGETLVGVSGNYSLEVTVPGPAIERAAGVTWVGVAPTHRRQGILTQMMNELHADADAHGEALVMLTASEGAIYQRFGYGVASQCRVTEIDRRRTEVRAEHRPQPGEVMLADGKNDVVLEQIAALHDRVRRQCVGDIDRPLANFRLSRESRGAGARWAVHTDGYASWKVTAKWYNGHPAHEMELYDLVAATPEAHAALWHTVLSVDLVGPIRSFRSVSVDDHLPHLLTDPRALRTVELNDMLWIHVRDVRTALGARSYGTEDSLVIEVDGDRWKIDGSPEGAVVKPAKRRPDLVMDGAALGSIYLGGFRPSELVRGRRIEARNPGVLRRADHFFSADRRPYTSTSF